MVATFDYFDDIKFKLERKCAGMIQRAYRRYRKRKQERIAKRRAQKGKNFRRSTTNRFNRNNRTATVASPQKAPELKKAQTIGMPGTGQKSETKPAVEEKKATNEEAKTEEQKATTESNSGAPPTQEEETPKRQSHCRAQTLVNPIVRSATEDKVQEKEEAEEGDALQVPDRTNQRSSTMLTPEQLPIAPDDEEEGDGTQKVDLDLGKRRLNTVANFAAALASPKIPFLEMFAPDIADSLNLI